MTEKEIHLNVCTYLKTQYKKVIFTSDLSGLRLSIGQSVQVKKMRSSNGIPDILIFKPKIEDGKIWHGLFIELKKDNVKLFKKDGSIVSDHIKEQFEMRYKLLNLRYFTSFVFGFDEAIKMIDWYMNLEDCKNNT